LTESKERCAYKGIRTPYCRLRERFCEGPSAYNSCNQYVPKSQFEASARKDPAEVLKGAQEPEEISKFLRPIDYLPHRRRAMNSFYDEVVREFVFSGLKYAEIKDLGRKPITVLIMLKNRVKRRKESIQVYMRNKKIYLERLEPSESSRNLLNGYVSGQVSGSDQRVSSAATDRPRPSADVVTLLNTAIIKAKCPRCKGLNAKDARKCKDCGEDFYSTEEEYMESLKSFEKLEKELNGER